MINNNTNTKINTRLIKYLMIFLIAISIRTFIGYIFFGSIDLINTISNSKTILSGKCVNLPYFPFIQMFIWLGGILNIATNLPLAFCYKIIPVFFDSLIAILIYDIVSHKNYRQAFAAGMLYALCPVCIIINCLHCQWDSIALFFLLLSFHIRDNFQQGKTNSFLFGLFLALSIIAKPIGLIFLLIVFSPFGKSKKRYLNSACTLIALLIVFVLSIACAKLFGYSMNSTFRKIFENQSHGIQIFGLPFAWPFSYIKLLHLRFWIPYIIIFFSFIYYLNRFTAFDTILAGFVFMLAVCGLGPQYLIWIVPFLLLTCRFKWAAIYTLIATSFLVLYYINPFSAHFPFENMNTFTTIKNFSWLMPSLNYSGKNMLGVIHLIGNYLIPFFSFSLLTYLVLLSMRQKITLKSTHLKVFKPLKNIYIWLMLFVFISLLLISAVTGSEQLNSKLNSSIDKKLSVYMMKTTNEPSLEKIGFIGDYSDNSTINIVTILFATAALWGIFSIKASKTTAQTIIG